METSLLRLSPATPPMNIAREAESHDSASFNFGAPAHSTTRAFIEANTVPTSFAEVRRDHIIPVFVKDNEPLISQADFIQVTAEAVRDVFRGEQILAPQVRVSHPIKGRIPEAKDKPAAQLHE